MRSKDRDDRPRRDRGPRSGFRDDRPKPEAEASEASAKENVGDGA